MDDRTTITERLREIIAADDVKRFSEIMDELGYTVTDYSTVRRTIVRCHICTGLSLL